MRNWSPPRGGDFQFAALQGEREGASRGRVEVERGPPRRREGSGRPAAERRRVGGGGRRREAEGKIRVSVVRFRPWAPQPMRNWSPPRGGDFQFAALQGERGGIAREGGGGARAPSQREGSGRPAAERRRVGGGGRRREAEGKIRVSVVASPLHARPSAKRRRRRAAPSAVARAPARSRESPAPPVSTPPLGTMHTVMQDGRAEGAAVDFSERSIPGRDVIAAGEVKRGAS